MYWFNWGKHNRRKSRPGDSGAARFLARRRAIKAGKKLNCQNDILFRMFYHYEDELRNR